VTLGVNDLDACHQAVASDMSNADRLARDPLKRGSQSSAHLCSVAINAMRGNITNGRGAGGKGQLIAAKGSRVGAGRPAIEIAVIDDDR
jgi:hypothetical protein